MEKYPSNFIMDSFPWLEGSFLEYKNRHFITKTKSYSSLCEESNGNFLH